MTPHDVTAMFAEAARHQRTGRFAEAEALYRAVLAAQPASAEVHYNLALLFHVQGRLDEAIGGYRRAVTLNPAYAEAYANLGAALQALGRADEAVAACRQAVALAPGFAMAHGNLGAALLETGAAAESIAASRQAIALAPDMPLAYCNLGAAFHLRNDLAEAVAAYRAAIALAPDFAEAHFCLAHALLLQGNLAEGWPEFSWRWKLGEYGWLRTRYGDFTQPLWMGERLDGKTLLVYAEKGLGDAIHYSRYLPLAAQRCGRVILAVQPSLVRLLRPLAGVEVIALDDQSLPPFDVHCPLLNLPGVFGTTLDSIPAALVCLRPDPAAIARWRGRVSGTGLRVGVVWAGNPEQRGDRIRSPRLAAMAPLFAVPGVTFVALQVGPGREDMTATPLPGQVTDLGEEIADMADTAAIMAGLDLVITSCTAPLHLSATLGVPSWGIIPFAPYFPWLLERPDSAWYPSLRLYRQDQPGCDWSGVMQRVAADLAALA
ncbi:MAG TPA: tetratricopeptide repeat protein [Patescibacteria group bacterium]|nr:tetratricopeptide repeat protein [Patescibacteria group bacterium]